MFQEDIYTLLSTDASINSYADHIFGKRIPSDTGVNEETDTIITFDYSKENSVGSRDGSGYISVWKLYIDISSPNSDALFALGDRLEQYLTNCNNPSTPSIEFDGDNQSYDPERDIYFNNMEFSVLYVG
jgi:hypothetical protein